MRNKFDREMQELNGEIVKMGGLIEMTIGKVMHALKESNYDLAREVAANDQRADELELSVERKSMRILLSEQPVASDLRMISTALKMITDMERICDQAADISEIVLHFEGRPLMKKPSRVMAMAEKCVTMTSRAIDSFVTRDLELAREAYGLDDEIDRCFVDIREELVGLIAENPMCGEQAMDFLMIAKYLERIGDHAQNIAEWVIFCLTGQHKNQRIL